MFCSQICMQLLGNMMMPKE
uniref:Uncharacterized protein n=1 Tax=Rhizophora mucronata TaxID=61149 RepID=A0A2P2IVN1_RHIMU